MRGLTNEAAWIWCKPVSASASISLILSAVPIGPGSIWNPSRGPSSWISTCSGKSLIVLATLEMDAAEPDQTSKFSRSLVVCKPNPGAFTCAPAPSRVSDERYDDGARIHNGIVGGLGPRADRLLIDQGHEVVLHGRNVTKPPKTGAATS